MKSSSALVATLSLFGAACSDGTKAPETGEAMQADETDRPGTADTVPGSDTDTGAPDRDDDGYTVDAGDCDDEDPTAYPGAEEVCDARDNDCDGLVDDEDPDLPVQGYEDTDGDGYAGAETRSCDAEAVSTDCDEADPAVNSGAVETCETTWDDDCDGETNELDAIGCASYWTDEDGDGFSAGAESACYCEATEPYTTVETGDCDDADPEIFPGGARCRFEGAWSLEEADLSLSGEAEADFAGWSVAFAGDVDGDGADDLLVGAPSEDTFAEDGGAAYVVCDPLDGTAGLSAADAKVLGECTGCSLGLDVSGAGDTDGDGYDDLLVGEPYLPDGDVLTVGAALLFRGPLTGELSPAGVDGDADARLQGEHGSTGRAVASAGDQDLDGLADLLVGQPTYGGGIGGSNAGRAYVVSGLLTGSSDLGDSVAVLDGGYTGDYAGFALDGDRDLDGDGVADLAISAYLEDSGASQAGAIYVLYGPVEGEASLEDAPGRLVGANSGDTAGEAVALVPDVDGDGNADLVVGATREGSGRESNSGAAYLVTTPSDGSSSLADATATLDGEGSGSLVGQAVSGAGDMDLDGYGDVLVGSLADMAWLVYGPVSGTTALSDAEANWSGPHGSAAGASVDGGGDVDADGVPDLLIGARWDSTSEDWAGMAYLVLGSSS